MKYALIFMHGNFGLFDVRIFHPNAPAIITPPFLPNTGGMNRLRSENAVKEFEKWSRHPSPHWSFQLLKVWVERQRFLLQVC